MPPILAIILLVCVQIGIYRLLDKLYVPEVKYVALLLVWAVNVFVLPWKLIPKPAAEEGAVTCGMPVLSYLFSFWILGTICIIATHILYVIAQKNISNTQGREKDNYTNWP